MKGAFQRLATRIVELLQARRQSPAGSPVAAILVGAPTALGFSEPSGLARAASLEEALLRLDHEEIPVVLLDSEASGDWRCAVRRLAHTSCRPSVVLLSPGEPMQLWEEVAAVGGYDVVHKSAPPGALDHIIRQATVYWRFRRALDPARRGPLVTK